MREAFARERAVLGQVIQESHRSVSLLFVFKPRRTVDVRRLVLASVHADIAALCRMVNARL